MSKPKGKEKLKNLYQINGVWYFRLRVNGKFIRKTLKTTNLQTAIKERDRFLNQLPKHADDEELLISIKRQLTGIEAEKEEQRNSQLAGILLSDAFELWEKNPNRTECKQQRIENHRTNWRMFLEWLNRHYPEIRYMRQVTRETATEWAADLLQNSKSTGTYNHHLLTVKYIFKTLNAYDERLQNPLEHLKRRKASDVISKEPFSDDELKAIFSSYNHEFKVLCAIGLYTSLRLGSARKLTWEMFSKDLSLLVAIHDKTGADATQETAEELKQLLAKTPANERHGFICPTFAQMAKCNACQAIQDNLQKCGIVTQKQTPGLNGEIRTVCVKGFHSFRHTAITRALQHGASIAQVKRWAGHASERMQERYTHMNANDAGQAAAAVGSVWN